MTVRAYYDLWCDYPDCINWCCEATDSSIRRVRAIAKIHGWLHTRAFGDLCPECVEKVGRAVPLKDRGGR